MGTNYYVRAPGCASACQHCTETRLIHLGKSAAGWKFTHKADIDWPRDEAHARWLCLAASGPIEDEYGRPLEDLDYLLKFIASKQALLCHCVDNGPELSGPHFTVDVHWHDGDGYDFCAREFF